MDTAKRLLGLVLPYWRRIVLATLLGFATIASSVGLLMTSAWLIASAALQPSIADLQIAIVGVRFFGISRGVFRYLERFVSHQVNFKLLARLRVWFYARLEPLAPARLQQYHSGDLLTRIVADINTLEHFFVRVLAPPLVAILITALMWVLLAGYDWRVPLALTVALVLAGTGLPLLAYWLGRRPGDRLVSVRSQLNAALVDGMQGLPELAAFNQEGRHLDAVLALNHETVRLQQQMVRTSALTNALMGLLGSAAVLIALLIAIPLVGQGELSGVSLAVITLGAMASFEAVAPLPLAAQYLQQSLAAARRLFEVVDVAPVVDISSLRPVHPTAPEAAGPAHDSPPSLSFRKLGFSYEPGQPPVLKDLSFDLNPGQRLAIVGPSGAGKSTLVSLLLRFWEFEQGDILVNGRSVRDLDPALVRSLFGVVTQDTHLFNATIRDNLLLARVDADEVEIINAARRAQIHDFVASLPQGYDTWIGEQGLRLSGGQRQRLALARALLKNAPILVLDEPAANLDALTEQAMLEILLPPVATRKNAVQSVLMISHSLAGMERADEILVLKDGRVVERGQHRELLDGRGLYRQMWQQTRERLNEEPSSAIALA